MAGWFVEGWIKVSDERFLRRGWALVSRERLGLGFWGEVGPWFLGRGWAFVSGDRLGLGF